MLEQDAAIHFTAGAWKLLINKRFDFSLLLNTSSIRLALSFKDSPGLNQWQKHWLKRLKPWHVFGALLWVLTAHKRVVYCGLLVGFLAWVLFLVVKSSFRWSSGNILGVFTHRIVLSFTVKFLQCYMVWLTTSDGELKYLPCEHDFWRQQFQWTGRTLQLCFFFSLLSQ